MKNFIVLFIFTLPVIAFCQNEKSYINYDSSYENNSSFENSRLRDYRINEITINENGEYVLWSRPYISCFTWKEYKGKWTKKNDTITFFNQYEVYEEDVVAEYSNNSKSRFYQISFNTDKKSNLIDKQIRVSFQYDYDSKYETYESVFILDKNNTIQIPYNAIKHLEYLSALRIEYFLDNNNKRFAYLTQNNPLNVKTSNIPNIINVTFIESPKNDTVYRIFKAVVDSDILRIVNINRSVSTLPDYNIEIIFENFYKLRN